MSSTPAAIGPDGPVGYATNVSIEETNDPATGHPRTITVGKVPLADLTSNESSFRHLLMMVVSSSGAPIVQYIRPASS